MAGADPFRSRLVAAWYAPRLSWLTAPLWPLSLVYRLVVALRRALFRVGVLRVERLAVPVVIVGNIAVGGTGKTPLVRALAEALAARGWRPGIVSRGYGGRSRAPRAVTSSDDPALVGDEPLLLAASGVPVWIGRARAAAGRALLAAHPSCDVVLADDGLQHYALARDVEIAVVDAARGFGNGCLLPAGPLREPRSRLRDVDAIVRLVERAPPPAPAATRAAETTMTLAPLAWRNVRDPAQVADPARWRGARVHALAGIGNPQRFFALVRAQGIAAIEHAFPDHHVFAPADLAFDEGSVSLMTEKDAVKCRAFADERCWYLPVRAQIDPALVALVEERVRGSQVARDAGVPGHEGPADL